MVLILHYDVLVTLNAKMDCYIRALLHKGHCCPFYCGAQFYCRYCTIVPQDPQLNGQSLCLLKSTEDGIHSFMKFPFN